jgi:hypothetical protein
LGEQSYIQRTNPKLAAYLAAHPEIARNPDYYLFTNMQGSNGNRTHALERQLWPEYLHGSGTDRDDAINTFIISDLTPIIIVPAVFFALAWGLRSLVQGRRQSKLLKTQSDLQTRLIDKLGSSQELTAYLASESGQKLLAGFGTGELNAAQSSPSLFTFERFLRPLQAGGMLVVLSLGALVLLLASREASAQAGLFALTVILFAVGFGFILSAGIAWLTAKKLGVLPAKATKESALTPTRTIDRP